MMASGLSGALQYEDLQGATPDIEADPEASDAGSSSGNDAFYTLVVPEQGGENDLSVWTSLVDAAWGIREPFASIQEKGMYMVLRSFMAHAFFEMSVASVVTHCQILCLKLGIRCDPNRFCRHYQLNAGSEEGDSGQPRRPRYERTKRPLCKLTIDQDPLIN